jgi:hypothetical protein
MSKQLILLLLAGAAMAQSGAVEQTVVWQRARTNAPAHTYTASKPAADQPAADQKLASAQSTATDPEVAEAVRWERAKDRAAQRQIAKSKKK